MLENGIDGLRRVANDLLAAGPATPQRLLVSVDQVEELFTRTTLAALQRFMHLLRSERMGQLFLGREYLLQGVVSVRQQIEHVRSDRGIVGDDTISDHIFQIGVRELALLHVLLFMLALC